MIFSLDVRRARQGDCMLLHFGTKADPGLVVIDGGPRSVYKPFLKPRLEQIRAARGLADEEALVVDALMVSHVDDDHIQGILDLTKELIGAARPRVRILGLWHNTFDDVIDNVPGELTAAMTAAFGPASVKGELPANAVLDVDEDEAELARDILKILASIAQGHQLRDDAKKLGVPLNPPDGKLILAKDKRKVGAGFTFLIAGPAKAEVLALQKDHDKWLKAQKKKPKAPAALAAYVDESVSNLSSIVAHVEIGKKSILFTGDARGDKVLEGLETVGLLKAGGKMHVDVLKVPHHGSSNNVDNDFFERVTADHYVASGDGQHGNPERETLEMIFRARKKEPFTLHLTYPIPDIDTLRKADWDEHRKEELAKAAKAKAQGKKPRRAPRKAWSAGEHSLAAFLGKAKPGPGQKVVIVDEKKPHVIDLLDPLGF